jgi:long-chain acyl-CoA synthetase
MFLCDHNKTALKWQEQEISYTELLSRVSSYAALFNESSSRVVIFSENRPEWIAAFYSAWKNNSTVIPVDYLSTVEEVTYIITDSRPQVFFCSHEREPVLRRAAESLDYSPQILVFEDIATDRSGDRGNSENSDLAAPDLNDTALIIYTSGTTGDPKGVMLSYDNILANVEAVSVDVPIYSREERVMLLLPLHHIFPLLGSMVAPLFVGALVAISPSLQSADIIHTLQSNRITIIIGVPRLYKLICKGIMDKIQQKKIALLLFLLAEKAGSLKLSQILFKSVHRKFGGSLKYLVCGGAALDIETGRNFSTLGFEILEGFGMT